MPRSVCVFDAYGTLFDVAGAARVAATEPHHEALADHWPALSDIWRRKQLEYTWIRGMTGAHADFWTVTCDALDYALEQLGLGDPETTARLQALYRELPAYPEVPDMLRALKAAGRRTAILSNGSPEMLASAVAAAKLGDSLDAVLSVEDVGIFKPDSRVYDLVGAAFGCQPSDVLFVSSNGWDAAAAQGYGFDVLWVNRAALPMDRLPWRPAHTARDLRSVPDLAAAP
jgi:2-haloacid dehalogenase